MQPFHEVRLPVRLSLGASIGLEHPTRVVSLASGHERRATPWQQGRRRYVIGANLRSLEELADLLDFFEARRGRLHGFRFRDPLAFTSGAPDAVPGVLDQQIGTGDGVLRSFQLQRGAGETRRVIHKPVAGTVRVAVAGQELAGGDIALDAATGLVTLRLAPAAGAVVTAGFEYDTPVRFDTDRLDLTLETRLSGRSVSLPLVELRL